MAVNDILQISVGTSLNRMRAANVFHYIETNEGDPAISGASQLINAFFEDVVPDWQAICSDQMAFDCFKAQRISPAPTGPIALVFTPATFGDVGGESFGLNMAYKIRWYTNLLSKRGRGRNFFSGIPETSQNIGTINPIRYSSLLDLRTTFLADVVFNATGYSASFGIWSRTGDFFNEVVAATPSAKVWALSDRAERLCV